jgi:hypothetical protein
MSAFGDIPAECIVGILQLLDADDLGSVAQVSDSFCSHTEDPTLPQNRTATVTCVSDHFDPITGTHSASPFRLFGCLRNRARSRTLDLRRFNKVKIIGHNLLTDVPIAQVLREVQYDFFELPHVQALDLSFPSDARREDTTLELCVPSLLAYALPNLREIDLSSACVPELALRLVASSCPSLEKVTWNHHQENMIMSGTVLGECQCLTEIHMDDSVFLYATELPAFQAEGGDVGDYDILSACSRSLERVSIMNPRCSPLLGQGPTQISLRNGLINFVRNTPTLVWFRSDLSPEDVAILQAVRPRVTFAVA